MATFASLLLIAFIQHISWNSGLSSEIKLEHCLPPDYPQNGDYGPKKDSYDPGDIIHYFCNTGTYMGGNYLRICFDTGGWSGDTPVCDAPAPFSNTEQSSTEKPEARNKASRAADGQLTTCSKTLGETSGAVWTGRLQNTAREAIRVMLFLPKGDVAYEVFIIKSNGEERSCGSGRKFIGMYGWEFHNCPQPHNTNAVAVKVKSLTKEPLEICELIIHTLTDPTCVDPHFEVDNGRLAISRKTAELKCNKGYNKWDNSPSKLDCVRTGVWSRKSFFCEESKTETIRGNCQPDNDYDEVP